jgi:hypothetical protein
MEYNVKEIKFVMDPLGGVIEHEEIDFLEKKRKHNKKNALKKTEVEEISENSNDCHFYYQSSSGENLFLHPLC